MNFVTVLELVVCSSKTVAESVDAKRFPFRKNDEIPAVQIPFALFSINLRRVCFFVKIDSIRQFIVENCIY